MPYVYYIFILYIHETCSFQVIVFLRLKQDRENTFHFPLSEFINVYCLCFKAILYMLYLPIKCFVCLQLKCRNIINFGNLRFINTCSLACKSEQYQLKEMQIPPQFFMQVSMNVFFYRNAFILLVYQNLNDMYCNVSR